MLKRVLFHIASAVAESQPVHTLLHSFETTGIQTVLLSPNTSLSAYNNECLLVTDSTAGITSARAAGVPCIGYIPPGSVEDMSGAYALFEDFSSIDTNYICRAHAHAVGYPADILFTERLAVREFSVGDFPSLYAMYTEPSTVSFMEETFSDYTTELEKHTAYIHNVYPFFDLALWGVFDKASGKLIGRAGFSLSEDDNHTFSLGYLIDIPYRRQGYAKELIPALLSYAKEQGYTKISARIKQENVASVKALGQCGYPYERTGDTPDGVITYLIHLTV